MSEIKDITTWDHFAKRPGMYIGKRSIYGLQCFICGCRISGNDFGVDWEKFEKFVTEKIKWKTSSKSYGAALYLSDNLESEAFDLWMQWFEEFKKV